MRWRAGGRRGEAQLRNIAALPFVAPHVAVMPDVHLGKGATVGSVIPTARRDHPGRGRRRHRLRHDGGAHHADAPATCPTTWRKLRSASRRRCRMAQRPRTASATTACRTRVETRRCGSRTRPRGSTSSRPSTRRSHDPHRQAASSSARSAAATTSSRSASTRRTRVWVMLHSGSRGVGNRIGTLLHRAAARSWTQRVLGDPAGPDLAYFEEGEPLFDDYVEAVGWAQDFARAQPRGDDGSACCAACAQRLPNVPAATARR